MAKRRRNKKKKESFLRILFRYFFGVSFTVLAVGGVVVIYVGSDLPDLSRLKMEIRSPSVVIQTYDGQILGSYGDLYEDVIKVEDLPVYVPQAFMAIEDKRFLNHFGIDFIGFIRAIYQNYVSGHVVQGGSTITQQLAKNILIGEGIVTHYDRSITRKIKELILAFSIEEKFTKSQIMMMYLNRVYFGAGTYGIDAASRKYFNKSAKQLNEFEAAILAGLLKAPSRYSPLSNFELTKERAGTVLTAMEEQGFIKSAAEISRKYAKEKEIFEGKTQSGYMFFCDYVYDQARKILGDIEDDIIIVSTLDPLYQKSAEETISDSIKENGERYKFSQLALVCLAHDGAIKAMVGGKSYTATQFNRATQSQRQMGSAFKPFVYGAALEYGYQLHDMISDAPVSISGWKPMNYKWKTRGQISILDGITYSVNSVSIRLAQSIGLQRIANFCEKLGLYEISTHDLSVAIGSSSTTLLNLTSAYTSFFDGNSVWGYGITEIRTKSGDVLYKRDPPQNKRVIDDETLTGIRTMLRSVIQNGTGRAANISPYIFGKTGSNGDTDAWFLGFLDDQENNKRFSVGIWCGNDSIQNKMTKDSTGGKVPTRTASAFFKKIDGIHEKIEENKEPDSENQTSRRDMDGILDNI